MSLRSLTWVVILIAAGAASAATLQEAYTLYNTGKYAEAAAAYEKLAADKATAAEAAVGLARVALQDGTYEPTLAKIEAALKDAPKNADLLTAKGELLTRLGRYAEAAAAAATAVDADANHFGAHLLAAEMLERAGQIDKAVAAYRWFEKAEPKTAEQMTQAGDALMRVAQLTGEKIAPQARTVLVQLYQGATKADKDYWPAHVAAGDLLANKFNLPEAADEYRLALKINENLPDVLVSQALIALGELQFEAADAAIEKALKINPNHAGARVAEAMVLLRGLQLDEVAAPLEKALKVNPNDLDALAVLTALRQRTGKQDEADALIARAEKTSAAPFDFHELVADLNSWGRQYPVAEAHYRKALAMAPNSADIMNGLGRVLMETGRINEAFPLLEKAHKLDGFSVRTLNTLNLLDELVKFAKFDSPDVQVKLDRGKDELLGPLFSDYLESIYPELTRRYGKTLDAPEIVEVYPDHSKFAVRMTGRPAIWTIGACFGKVIAMDSPRPGVVPTKFNWARVLRHEFTHAVTLAATENRVSHWFTEACATTEERRPRKWQWCQMLAAALASDRLFPVSELTWGFVRPRRPGDRELAYAQAQWTYEFIQAAFGQDHITKLLDAYRDKYDQEAIFQDVFGFGQSEFDKRFREWARKDVANWGILLPPQVGTVEEETKTVSDKPEDADAQARLGWARLTARNQIKPGPNARGEAENLLKEAEAALRNALKADPRHPGAMVGLIQILEATQRGTEAGQLGLRLIQNDPGNPVGVYYAAQQSLSEYQQAAGQETPDAEDLAKTRRAAIAWFTVYTDLRPNDPMGPKALVQLMLSQNDTEGALPYLEWLERLEDTDLLWPKYAALIHKKAGRTEKAIHYYRLMLQIDPYNKLACTELVELLEAAGQAKQAEMYKNMLKLLGE